MASDQAVIGHFKYIGETQSAISSLRDKGYEEVELYSPFPCHELDDEMHVGKPRSGVRRFTLLGGLAGCLGAFLMTCWMSVDYPVRTSAKPLMSIPAFVVIAFECTILIGAISTLVGMLHNSRIPNFFRMPAHRPEFTKGTFGLTVTVAEDQVDAAKQDMQSLGAREVEVQYVR